jgi:predicted transcriptional regulator
MDRLVDKHLLKRQKTGKKFCYKSVESREKMAETAIYRLAGQYFNNDVRSLLKALEKQCTRVNA